MTRNLDFETPAELLRIQLVCDLSENRLHMSRQLELIREYDTYQQVRLLDALERIVECDKGKSTASYMRNIAKKAL